MNRRFSIFLFALILALCSFVRAQNVRAQNVRATIPFPSVSSQYTTPFLVANVAPNLPIIAFCNYPANNLPCSNYATTFTSSGAACPNGAQNTPDPQPSACQSTGDAQGNLGVWATPGFTDTGTAAQFESHGTLKIDLAAAATGALTEYGDQNTGVTTPAIDTSQAIFMQLTVALSSASASNSVTQRHQICELIGY